MQLPLFPLNLVIFPAGILPLRIFEPRYLQMVRDCAKNQQEFVVCSLGENQTLKQAAESSWVGTACEIIDFETMPDGLLGITARGTRRVMISEPTQDANELILVTTETIPEEPDESLPDSFLEWSKIIPLITQKMGGAYANQEHKLASAQWVGARMAEYLPFELAHKQRILEIDYPLIRLNYLQDILQEAEYYLSKGNLS